MFITVAAEQFGTNLRSTVTTSAPNLVRASTIPMTILFQAGVHKFGVVTSATLVGGFAFAIAILALTRLEETFHKDVDFLEGGERLRSESRKARVVSHQEEP